MSYYLDYTLDEFRKLACFAPKDTFNEIIFVPMNELHDSGFQCMKFVLGKRGRIVGVVSGWSDVAHINGIGGYGRQDYSTVLDTGKTKRVNWAIDCLPKSQCIRLFSYFDCVIDDGLILSDFSFYVL